MRHTKKIRLLASALLLASQIGTATAAPTPQEARAIVSLVDARNYIGLRDYITANPQLLEGNDLLTVALRQFMLQINVIDSTGVTRLDGSIMRTITEQASIY